MLMVVFAFFVGFNHPIQKVYRTKWLVNCEPAITSDDHVVKYLGQYTHRVDISGSICFVVTSVSRNELNKRAKPL